MDDHVMVTAYSEEPSRTVSWFCQFCGLSLTMVTDPMSGVVDFGADGDFGCDGNPETDEEGSASHGPVVDALAFRAYWARIKERSDHGDS